MEQHDLLSYGVNALERIGIPYMVVGSIASSAYGEPRLTQDIDIVIDATADQVRVLCAAFPTDDFYVSVDAAIQAARSPGSQFNVLHPESGDKIDFMIARKDSWGREQVSRRQRILLLPGKEAYAARPEDVIIAKMLYYQEGGSEKHMRDITGMLKVSGTIIDRDYIARWAANLNLTDVWQAILRRIGSV